MEFPDETVVTKTTMVLCTVDIWYGQIVDINCTMVHYSGVTVKEVKDRVDSQPEINIQRGVIDMPPTVAEGSEDKVEQITRQVSDKLVTYVSKQVHHMETMVQDKINPQLLHQIFQPSLLPSQFQILTLLLFPLIMFPIWRG